MGTNRFDTCRRAVRSFGRTRTFALALGLPVIGLLVAKAVAASLRSGPEPVTLPAASPKPASEPDESDLAEVFCTFMSVMHALSGSGMWRMIPDELHMRADLLRLEAIEVNTAGDLPTAARLCREGLGLLAQVPGLRVQVNRVQSPVTGREPSS